MTEEEFARALCRAHVEGVGGWGEGAWLAVARRARELLSAPTLPAEPSPGFVRVRVPVAVGDDGSWCVDGARGETMEDMIEATDWFRREGRVSRVSFATFDVPLPTAQAEITGVVE